MNLQEILGYRDKCVLCQHPLEMCITKYPKLSINRTDEGLKIRSGHQKGIYLFYGYDGKFERNKRDYKINQTPVTIQKRCPVHPTRNGPVTRLSGGNGGTSINTLRDLSCNHSFTLIDNHNGGYTPYLLTEFIYHHDDEKFLHVNTWFESKYTTVYAAKFCQRIDEVLRLKLPPVNLKAVQNVEQLYDKIKLYTLFS